MGKRIYKTFVLELTKTKELNEKGTFDGFASTPTMDRDGDIILPEAFINSIQSHKDRGKTYLKLLFNHDRDMPIGGIPLDKIEIKDKGVFFKDAFLDLNVQKAREVHSLMKNKVLSELSIGFFPTDFERQEEGYLIKELEWLETSVVTEPANQEALIMNVKQFKKLVKEATLFRDLPLADRDREWDSDAAIERVREITGSQESPTRDYKDAFFYYDRDKQDNFTAYRLPFADVIDNELYAVPRGIFAAAAALRGARGGVDFLTDLERDLVEDHINKYYEKMDLESPFKQEEDSENEQSAQRIEDNEERSLNEEDNTLNKDTQIDVFKRLIDITSLQNVTQIEKCLKAFGFSNKQAKQLISVMKSVLAPQSSKDLSDSDVLVELKACQKMLNKLIHTNR